MKAIDYKSVYHKLLDGKTLIAKTHNGGEMEIKLFAIGKSICAATNEKFSLPLFTVRNLDQLEFECGIRDIYKIVESKLND